MKLTRFQRKILLSILSNRLGKTSKEIIADIYGPDMYNEKRGTFKVLLCNLKKQLTNEGYRLNEYRPYQEKFVGRTFGAWKIVCFRFDEIDRCRLKEALR
jgi:hypothetical protein